MKKHGGSQSSAASVSLSPFPLCPPPGPVVRVPEAAGTKHGGPPEDVQDNKVEAGLQLRGWVLVSRGFARGLSFGLSQSGGQRISGMTSAGQPPTS